MMHTKLGLPHLCTQNFINTLFQLLLSTSENIFSCQILYAKGSLDD